MIENGGNLLNAYNYAINLTPPFSPITPKIINYIKQKINDMFIIMVRDGNTYEIDSFLNIIDNHTRSEALRVAINENNFKMVKYMVEHDADINYGHPSALQLAMYKNNYESTNETTVNILKYLENQIIK